MKDPKQIEDFLNQQFDDFELKPGPGSFDSFMTKLDAAREKKKRRVLVYFLLSGLAAALVVTLGVYVQTTPFESIPATRSQLSEEPSKVAEAKNHVTSSTVTKAPETKTTKKQGDPSPKYRTIASRPSVVPTAVPNGSRTTEPSVSKSENPKLTEVPQFVFQDTSLDSQTPTVPDHTTLDKNNSSASLTAQELLSVDYLPSIHSSVHTERFPLVNSNQKAEQDLLHLQTIPLKARFFVGISGQVLVSRSSYSKNSGANVNKTGYTEDFNASYIQQREKNKTSNLLLIPGLKFGIAFQRYEMYAGFGYYQLTDKEKVFVPQDSLNNTSGFGSMGPLGAGNGSGQGATNLGSASQDVVNQQSYVNRFNYLYAGIGANIILNYYSYKLKPGLNLSYNKIVTGSYVLVDTDGYKRVNGSQQHLNSQVFSLALNCSFSKKLSRNLELQISPVYRMSLSSLFDSQYFNSQTYKALGLEGALIYKFPLKFKPKS